MSVEKSVWISCDHCRDSYGSHGDYYETAAEARERARQGGWHYYNGHDICPDDWAKGLR